MSGPPRVLIAGLRGGSGKTLVTVGLVAAWRSQGRAVAVFKKGPDYIDAAWLSRAAGRPCRNLDLFLQPAPMIVHSVTAQARTADLTLIEGNRGFYDAWTRRVPAARRSWPSCSARPSSWWWTSPSARVRRPRWCLAASSSTAGSRFGG
jgi:cobyrinic acid a,c-diamide synthase